MRTILITGANRGIGLALATRYAKRPETHVIATTRERANATELQAVESGQEGRLRVVSVDVADAASIAELAKTLARENVAIDVLINNAGIAEWETFGDVDGERATQILRVNAVGPVLVSQALRPFLRRGSTIVNVTSTLGSIERADGSIALAYSMSKAALNMFGKHAAGALRADGIAVLQLHPGWVRTSMGGDDATLSVDQSADGIVQVIDGFDLARSGAYLAYDGSTLPW